ncbi:EmmdR/YeeO family multidrug/toxin efflux MATE transporter [Vibrio mangrovi]|uniref:Multidrug resistance protein NorM n=1 Tax=Vibrio mangrovi TaxID=474394 RepID=A0A1Y6IUL9_9VIBR|nr:EmmdR/YeeO family multidrug/toxin efflux MATE transporter [Vibrio mangrovi]MDW6001792.1 EmmdR/YeeO family multidrug/toxin efflux MATE transporter [Vibrio mangrovi]SMS00182.1 Multidrug resistance protein NorM [Vibrio mangrovi]
MSETSLSMTKPAPRRRFRFWLRERHLVLFRRDIWPFAWPIFIELSCVVMMGIISTVLVSRLGAEETAAVGITDSVTWIVISVLTAIALGGSVVIAQAFGRSDREKALDCASQVVTLGVVISLVALLIIHFFVSPILSVVAYGAATQVVDFSELYLRLVAYSYPALAITLAGSGVLRAIGNSRLPAISNIMMNLLNILFSYPLIYGFNEFFPGSWTGLGLVGAGIGIIAARWSGALLILVCLVRNTTLKVRLRQYFRPFQRETMVDILAVGIPASVESLMFNLGKLITQIMVAGMGTVAMAGNVVTFSVLLLLNIPGNTLAMTATVLIGKRLGQQKPNVAYQEMKLIFWIATVLLTLFALVIVPVAENVARFYTTDTAVVEVVTELLLINALMIPIWAASFVLPSAFKGAKDATFCMWVAIASMWGGRIILGYILGITLNMNIYGIWLGMYADWWVRGIIYFYRMITKRWLSVYYRKST